MGSFPHWVFVNNACIVSGILTQHRMLYYSVLSITEAVEADTLGVISMSHETTSSIAATVFPILVCGTHTGLDF